MTIPHQTLTDKDGDRLSITRPSNGLYVTVSSATSTVSRTAGPFTRAQLDELLDELAPNPDVSEQARLGRIVQDVRDGGGHTTQISGVLIAPCDTYGRTRDQVAQQLRIDTLQRDLEQERAAFEQTGRDLQTMIGYRDAERARADKAESERGQALRETDRWREHAKSASERADRAEKERDEARATKDMHKARADEERARADAAKTDLAAARVAGRMALQQRDAERERADVAEEQLAAEPRPLTVTDEMVARAHAAAAGFGTAADISASATFAMLTAALTDPPARPEGAEELGELIGTWTATEDIAPAQLPTGSLATLADFLAERGVRVVGEERS